MVDLPLLDQLAEEQREAIPEGCLECGCNESKYIGFPEFEANGVYIKIVCEECDAERLEYYVFRSAITWKTGD